MLDKYAEMFKEERSILSCYRGKFLNKQTRKFESLSYNDILKFIFPYNNILNIYFIL